MQALISQVDNLMACTLPAVVFASNKEINQNKLMVMRQNTNAKNWYLVIFDRLRRCIRDQDLWYKQEKILGSPNLRASRRIGRRSLFQYTKNIIYIFSCEFTNLLIHTCILVLRNLQKVFFSYLSPFFIIAIQIFGYHLNTKSKANTA